MNKEKRTLQKKIVAWAMYDFANSAFTTIIVTFVFAAYFTQEIASDKNTGTALWADAIAFSSLVIAILSPVIGAVSDRIGYRKHFLFGMTTILVAACASLYGVEPGQVGRALTLFIIANIAFELGIVFYNSFLPDFAPKNKIGRISGFAWAMGYIGGLLALTIVLFGFIQADPPWFGLSSTEGQNIRATNLLTAAWIFIFSLPLFFWLKDDKPGQKAGCRHLIKGTALQLLATFRELKNYRQIIRFLFARIMYNDGLLTIFAFGGIYAAGTFNFTTDEIIMLGIVLNISAGAGSLALGYLDDLLGSKHTLLLSIAGLVLATILAVAATTKFWFWVAGITIGLFVGPNQASSRAMMARFIPMGKENEFFGFFAFSGKATAFLGPLMLGKITSLFGSQRLGVASLLIFFIAGATLLLRVDEKEGIAAAKNSRKST